MYAERNYFEYRVGYEVYQNTREQCTRESELVRNAPAFGRDEIVIGTARNVFTVLSQRERLEALACLSG